MATSSCGLVIRTTHVTGIVTDLGLLIGHWLRHRRQDTWRLLFLGCLFTAFLGGGMAGTLSRQEIIGRLKSSSAKPTACSMARLGERCMPPVVMCERGLLAGWELRVESALFYAFILFYFILFYFI